MDLLDKLNPPQREAVLYFDGPLLVLAGAGSGKTRVLTHKIAYMVKNEMLAPHQVLAVTFTNKAAGEMKERIASLCGAAKFPWMGTFHSICVRMLRSDGPRLGIPSSFTIYDRNDQISLVKDILKELNTDDEQLEASTALNHISRAKSRLEDPDEFAKEAWDAEREQTAKVYKQYQKRLMENASLDFDDLLGMTVKLLREHPDVLEKYRRIFNYTLIDEYQDVNLAQHTMLQLLVKPANNICAVGDDDQSIYAFRGADVGIILQFDRDFPKAHTIKLEENYRSTGAILEAANRLVRHNTTRHDKTLWTSNPAGALPIFRQLYDGYGEARYVVREILRERREQRRPWEDFAILYRANAQSRAMEQALIQEGVPYKIVGGVRFTERKEIKDLMGYLWVIVNPQDEVNLKRIINTPPRGIGTTTMKRLEESAERENMRLFDVVRDPSKVRDLTPKALAALREVSSLITRLQTEAETRPVSEILKRVIDGSGYEDYLQQENSAEAQSRLQNVEELVNMAVEFESKAEEPTLKAFLEQNALVADVDNYDTHESSVTLMTLHSAKGLEFPVVFLVGLEDDTFPSARCRDNPSEMEEERRLCYVGLTRAQEKLYLSAARTRMMYGETLDRIPSQFIRDIPPELLDNQTTQDASPDDTDGRTYGGGRGWDDSDERPLPGSRYGSEYNRYDRQPGRYSSAAPARSVPATTTPPRISTSASNPIGSVPRQTVLPPAGRAASSRSRSSSSSSSRSSSESGRNSSVTTTRGGVRPPTGPPPPPPEPFDAGERVEHKVFGIGVVSKCEKEVASVVFPDGQTRTIVAKFLQKAAAAPAAPSFSTGDRIRHPQYGTGVLKNVEQREGGTHLVAVFEGESKSFELEGSRIEKVAGHNAEGPGLGEA